MVQDSETSGGVCRKCCRDMTPGATVRLWDAKDYCETCVEEACPGLAEYARSHPALEEGMPHSAWRIGATIAIVGTVGIVGFVIVLWAGAVALGAPPIDPDGLSMALLFTACSLPIAIVFGIVGATGFASCRPVVSVRDNQLRITMHSETRSTPLSDCEWYIGKTWHMTHPRAATRYSGLLRDTAVVIILPQLAEPLDAGLVQRWDDPQDIEWNWPRRVATGFAEETRRRWTAFLTLATVPRRAFGLPKGSSV